MRAAFGHAAALATALACCARLASADPFLLGPPREDAPVVVHAHFELRDINQINDEDETFEFAGVLTLRWRDPRQAFDPAAAGVDEKVFQGSYQFDELSTGWYPQVVLANESGLYQTSGVLLRVRADGTSTLVQTIDAAAEAELDMRRFPYDSQRLDVVFEVLGFGRDEVLLQVEPDSGDPSAREIRLPQWAITDVRTLVRDRGASSALVVSIDVKRRSFFVRRLVIIPLIAIVLLSFSVFWMDRSSLGDRMSVSFIGVLTAVTYQLVMSDHLPRISYFTLMHGFLSVSFLTVCATVVINVAVSLADRHGRVALGNLIDRSSRWVFPLAYSSLLLGMLAWEYLE